eukprot:CAMPEP_0179892382 /NCGR_PEP_ID=MMETSP0982-20121206/34188_1 /TAXON_ID=483367 /ORGANISM="non described non described, Strain CCMP 2436" /LENGTH=131 /DNA_ID=CAMNT_0021788833 /DNA_START=234 /DNA_END=629 /DNA_ORIENTATION=-
MINESNLMRERAPCDCERRTVILLRADLELVGTPDGDITDEAALIGGAVFSAHSVNLELEAARDVHAGLDHDRAAFGGLQVEVSLDEAADRDIRVLPEHDSGEVVLQHELCVGASNSGLGLTTVAEAKSPI